MFEISIIFFPFCVHILDDSRYCYVTNAMHHSIIFLILIFVSKYMQRMERFCCTTSSIFYKCCDVWKKNTSCRHKNNHWQLCTYNSTFELFVVFIVSFIGYLLICTMFTLYLYRKIHRIIDKYLCRWTQNKK